MARLPNPTPKSPRKREPLDPSGGVGRYTCGGCAKEFDRLRSSVFTLIVFCSHKCQAAMKPPPLKKRWRPIHIKVKRRPIVIEARTCPECGTAFSARDSNRKKYCCLACAAIGVGKQKRGAAHPNWNGGTSKGRPGTVLSFTTRQVKPDSICAECGSKDRLQAHHIEHYADRPDRALDETNIAVLCAPCHAEKHPECAALILKSGSSSIVLECSQCGAPFRANKSDSQRRYCSKKCYYADPNRPVRGGPRPTVTEIACPRCEKKMPDIAPSGARRKYCGKECHVAAMVEGLERPRGGHA